MAKSTEQKLELQAQEVVELQKQYESKLSELKETEAKIALFWKSIESEMIARNIKTIKGEFGSLTIAERINWTYTNELPAKFFKKVVDTKKLTDTFRLEGKVPKGAAPNYTKYLTKRIK